MQFVQSGESTSKFLRTLLTTTPSASHISDFRQQRRTDSRADKPDTFPGFDLEEITLSPRKRRRQAYSQLIRGLLEKTRERLETIRDVVKEEKQLRFQLDSDDDESGEMRDVDEAVSIFEFTDPDANDDESVRFTFANDANDDASHVSSISSAYTPSVPQKYFSSLLDAIGFNRIVVPSPSIAPSAQAKNENGQSDGDSILATYLFNPVLDIWRLARKKFNFNLNERNGDAAAAANTNDANDADDVNSDDELQLTIVYADSKMAEAGDGTSGGNGNAKTDERNGNENDNINQLLPPLSAESSYNDDSKIENMPSPNNGITKLNDNGNGNVVVGDANDGRNNDSRMHNNNKRNAPSTSSSSSPPTSNHIERAAQAFQNAFFKYSNYMPTTSSSSTTSTHDALPTTNVHGPSQKSTSMHNDVIDGTDGNGLLANFLDDSRSNIQIVPSGKSKINETTASAAADVDDKHPNSKRQSLESAGILVLEMFGTVIGLTWGAFSHVQSYFNNNRNNETMT